MSKWNQEERVYCMMKEMQKMGRRMTENTTTLMSHFGDMERTMECIEVYNTLSQQLLCMTDGMIEMANLSERYQARKREPFLLGHFFISITGLILPEVKKKHQSFFSYNGGVLHEHVVGDLQTLMKASIRILNNAVKYTGEGGNITIRLLELPTVEKKHAHYQLQVEDNGQGMAPDGVTKALSLYPEGGFGLPVAEGIFGKLGGGLNIESTLGTGTTVTADFFLELQSQFSLGEGELLGRKVLIYEENQEEKEEVKRLFVQLGADCSTVCSREDFEQYLDRRDLSEYDMICVGGRAVSGDLPDFLKNIRSKVGERTYIILISSCSNKESSVEITGAGADGYIQRPLFREGLQALLKNIEIMHTFF